MEQEAERRDDDDADDGANSVSLMEIVAFMLQAAKRHVWLGLSVGVSVALLGIAVAFVLPPRYDAEARILANPSVAVAPTLAATVGGAQAREPFAGSSELLMQKSNLIRIVEDAKLVQWFRTHRTVPQRIKDALFSLLSEPPNDEKLKIALAETLQTRMYTFSTDKVLTIHVGWNDPDMVQKLASLAEKSYLEMRRKEELAIITASIAIIEEEVQRAAQGIDQSLTELIRVRDQARQAALGAMASSSAAYGRATALARTAGSVPKKAGTEDAAAAAATDTKLTARLAEVRQRAQEIEAPWRRRQAELKFQMNDLRGTYGPEHPIMIQQQAKIAEAEMAPQELTQLRETERLLIAQLESAARTTSADAQLATTSGRASGVARASAPAAIAGTARVIAAGGGLLLAEKDDDPTIAPAKANLASAIQRYSEVTKRLDAARLDLTSSQVASQYRFSVVAEPERPRGPSKPIRLIAIMAAIGCAILLGLASGAIRDLLGGRVYEPWQVRAMGLPLLGTVNLKTAGRA